MSRRCQVTGRAPCKGRSYTLRGIAKKRKGIGLKITGKSKRRFLPNTIKKRFWHPDENRFITLKLSAAAIRLIDKKGLVQILKTLHES